MKHGPVTRTAPSDGDYPCIVMGCPSNATVLATSISVEGNSGGPGIELEIPYCSRHLEVARSGNADIRPAAASILRQPAVFMPALIVLGFLVAVGILGFLYSPDSALVWFILQAALIIPVMLFRDAPISAIAMGAWLAFFWIPLAVGLLHQVGALA